VLDKYIHFILVYFWTQRGRRALWLPGTPRHRYEGTVTRDCKGIQLDSRDSWEGRVAGFCKYGNVSNSGIFLAYWRTLIVPRTLLHRTSLLDILSPFRNVYIRGRSEWNVASLYCTYVRNPRTCSTKTKLCYHYFHRLLTPVGFRNVYL